MLHLLTFSHGGNIDSISAPSMFQRTGFVVLVTSNETRPGIYTIFKLVSKICQAGRLEVDTCRTLARCALSHMAPVLVGTLRTCHSNCK